ncbi:uncharacterized protein LOC125775479 [Bactrocera dorsalis]|uniref:Uncharacterized protein LOC125775479 n=1 Tax=Bactrocera dorsalis TaxID=27457 RepID=A0ABM3IYP3_BACDO|nr:uncharacterized protein LOC125775479 [Bactrocera dorsalis]
MEPQKEIRKRAKPQKKWSEEENDLILEYLLENVEIEKPNAQLYYKKLVEITNIDATTDMLRCKVRYWKQMYNKAEEWRKSTGAGIDVGDDVSSIKAKISQMCPNYERFSVLFGSKSEANCVVETYNPEVSQYCSDFADLVEVVEIPASSQSSAEPSGSLNDNAEQTTVGAEVATDFPTTPSFLEKVKKRAPKNILSELKDIQKKREQFFEQRIEIEKEKLNLEKLKLELDREKINKDFEIKKLELEQKERLAMIELKCKYNM